MIKDFGPHVLREHVQTLLQWGEIEGICQTQVVLLHGPEQVNLLGWALREFSRIQYDLILLLPHHINCCGDDNKLNIIQNIFAAAEKKDSVLILMPNAETSFFSDRTVDNVMSPMVADIAQRIEASRQKNKKLHIVFISNAPWRLDGKLLDSGRLDKSLLVLPGAWRETPDDLGFLNQLTSKVLTTVTEKVVGWLGSDPGGPGVEYLKELLASEVAFSLQHEALAQAMALFPSQDRKYLDPLLSDLEKRSERPVKAISLVSSNLDSGIDVQRLLSLLDFDRNDGVLDWVQTFLSTLESQDQINAFAANPKFESSILQAFIDLDHKSNKGMNFESMVTYWLQRAKLSQPDAVFGRILESYEWDWILNFFPYGKVEFSREFAWEMFQCPDKILARNVVLFHFLGVVRFDNEEGDEGEIAYFEKLVSPTANPYEQKMAAWLAFEKSSYTPPQFLVRLLKTKVPPSEISRSLTFLRDYQPLEADGDKAKIQKKFDRLLQMLDVASPLREPIEAFVRAESETEKSRIYKHLRSCFFERFEKGEFQ